MKVFSIIIMVAFSVHASTFPAPAPTPFVAIRKFGAFTNENGPALVLEKHEGLSEINGSLTDAATTQAILFANAAVNSIFTNFQNKIFP